MARMTAKVDDRSLQLATAVSMARTLGTYRAARFLFKRHWHITTALRVLVGPQALQRPWFVGGGPTLVLAKGRAG